MSTDRIATVVLVVVAALAVLALVAWGALSVLGGGDDDKRRVCAQAEMRYQLGEISAAVRDSFCD